MMRWETMQRGANGDDDDDEGVEGRDDKEDGDDDDDDNQVRERQDEWKVEQHDNSRDCSTSATRPRQPMRWVIGQSGG